MFILELVQSPLKTFPWQVQQLEREKRGGREYGEGEGGREREGARGREGEEKGKVGNGSQCYLLIIAK